jgi:ferredoxin
MQGMDAVWERAAKGPVAFVDCTEDIPCNPCEEACPTGAIVVGEDICALPRLDPELCNGCGACVIACPGMAVYLLDRRGREARVTVPYVMRDPLEKGTDVWVVDASGKEIGRGRVVSTRSGRSGGGTVLVTVEVPEELALKVRGVRYRKMVIEEPEDVAEYRGEKDLVVCRCEEISGSFMKKMLGRCFVSLPAARRMTRVGLGVCQGRFCQDALRDGLAAERGVAPEEVGLFRVRPPVRPVKLGRLGGRR